MDYIFDSKTEVIDWEGYSRYIQAIRDQLPPHIFAFASDSSYFDLDSSGTLHDAWFESLTVREVASGDRSEMRTLEVSLCLLGSYHDRRIHLQYAGVSRYAVTGPNGDQIEHTVHGDLITQEVRLANSGLFVHELLFERDATILVECSDFRHSEEMIAV